MRIPSPPPQSDHELAREYPNFQDPTRLDPAALEARAEPEGKHEALEHKTAELTVGDLLSAGRLVLSALAVAMIRLIYSRRGGISRCCVRVCLRVLGGLALIYGVWLTVSLVVMTLHEKAFSAAGGVR